MMRKALWVCVLPMAVAAMGMFGGGRPTDLFLQNASHISTPIVIERLSINGAKYINHPSVGNTSWKDPRGGGATLGALPWPEGRDDLVLIESRWVDVEAEQAFQVSIELPWQDFTIDRVVNDRLEITVVYGVNGEFKVVTRSDPDETGQYNGREIFVTCGTRAPEFDKRYANAPPTIPGLAQLLEMQDQPIASSVPPTSCPEGSI